MNFENGESLDYPAIWLRDNCQCTKCFETTSNSRVIDFQTFRDDTIPVNIQVKAVQKFEFEIFLQDLVKNEIIFRFRSAKVSWWWSGMMDTKADSLRTGFATDHFKQVISLIEIWCATCGEFLGRLGISGALQHARHSLIRISFKSKIFYKNLNSHKTIVENPMMIIPIL